MKRGIIILLRDSEPEQEVCLRLASILRAQGHDVQTIAGVIPALAKLHFDPPGLILSPAQLTGISGFELCRSLRRYEPTRRTPFLILTANVSQQEEAFKAGASDVISTPLREAEALARVQTHLELAELRPARQNGHKPSGPADSLLENNQAWIGLAMQSGRMYAFEWDRATDRLRRSGDSGVMLGLENDRTRDTLTSALQYVDLRDRQRFELILGILSPAYDTYDMQLRVQLPDGRPANFRVSGRGVFDAERRLTRIIGVAADITEQVAVQQELRDLHELIHNHPLAAALVNDLGRPEYINGRFSKTFGYELEEIAEPDTWRRFLAAVARPGEEISTRECEIAGKNGAKHLVEVSAASVGKRRLILFNEVARQGTGASMQDGEEWFRAMADGAPVMLWVSGPDKLCTFFNKNWLSFTGRTLEQEAGNGWTAGVHANDLERCLSVYTTAFDKREDFEIEYRLRRADGEYRLILDAGTPRFATDGTFAGYIGSAIDVSDLKGSQDQILGAQKLENLSVLAGGVAHDFNNLLSCILAHAHITMSELEVNSPVRDGIERIEGVAVRAAQIARQLMAFIGEEQQDLEAVDLAHLVEETAQLVRVCIPRRVRIEIDLPHPLVVRRANACQLRQVVMNLIVNAGEAIGERGGLISVTGARGCWYHPYQSANGAESPEGGFICLEVSDTGEGMTREVQRRIFDPFFSTKVSGHGLGLAAAQAIVRDHGGIIEVSSEPGRGSTVQILLPSETQLPKHVSALPPSQAKSSRQGSVLIVEDEAPLRISVAKMLSKKGFSVVEAADGNLAVDLIRDPSQDIALVLLDVTLPGKSSQEVFAELQRVRPRVKVIITSAYGRDNMVGPLKALDSRMFLRKPYHLAELVTVVGQALPKETAELSGGLKSECA